MRLGSSGSLSLAGRVVERTKCRLGGTLYILMSIFDILRARSATERAINAFVYYKIDLNKHTQHYFHAQNGRRDFGEDLVGSCHNPLTLLGPFQLSESRTMIVTSTIISGKDQVHDVYHHHEKSSDFGQKITGQ